MSRGALTQQLRARITKATARAFERALRELGPEQLCGFALYTDECAMSLSVTINSVAHLDEMSESPKKRPVNQWSPPEWLTENYAGRLFDSISNTLYALHDRCASDDDKFEAHVDAVQKACMDALLAVRRQIPTTISREFVLLFDISDYDDTDQLVRWARRLNGPTKTRPFAKLMR